MGRVGRKAITFRVSYALVLIVTLVPTFLHGAEKGETFVEKYRAAHEARDVEALKALVHWKGASERTRETIEQRLIRHLDRKIKSIEIRPLTSDKKFETHAYRPTLEPAGWLLISFKPQRGDSNRLSAFFVVGEDDGEYFITVAEPAH